MVEPAPALAPVQVAEREFRPTPEQRVLAEFIARRYRVAESASHEFVATAYRVGHEYAVDPVLILAVMAIESRYNPVAESSMGAMGLMQVIPRYHPEKLLDHGGEEALLDPEINIRVGTWVLHEYLGRFGEVEAALQKYAGAFDEPTSQYAGKVLAEKARLLQALARARPQA
jgi:soluble lytic murein transglycosylase-like protein